MTATRYEVMDECRKNLTKYAIDAFSYIPRIDKPSILDIGCGTGVTILVLAEKSNGNFHAVDQDIDSLEWLKIKIGQSDFLKRIKITQASIFDQDISHECYDIVLAEGLLNIIGFEKGLIILKSFTKKNGYLLIHDELKNDIEKREIFKEMGLVLINTIELSKDIWWKEYYACLNRKMANVQNRSIFIHEIQEIADFRNDPEPFASIYYILKKI